MVLLSAQGMDVPAIAKVAFTSEDRVRDVIRNFNADGFGSLYRGAGNNRPASTAKASSFLNTAGKVGRVTISERIEAGRRERRVLARVCRAAWRLEQAELVPHAPGRRWSWGYTDGRGRWELKGYFLYRRADQLLGALSTSGVSI